MLRYHKEYNKIKNKKKVCNLDELILLIVLSWTISAVDKNCINEPAALLNVSLKSTEFKQSTW